jgi:hypothetical protein
MENISSKSQSLVLSHGVMVRKGSIGVGDFIKSFSIPGSGNSYYKGSFDELRELVKSNFHNSEPGSGSVDGDVLLINVPADDFVSSVVEITEENRDRVVDESYVRAEGEKPVTRKIMRGEMTPAKFAQVVVYRADVLARDSGRSTDDEWEMIAVLGKIDKVEPMHPETMKRNNLHEEGGTYREYSDEEWEAAHDYWDNHAYIIEEIQD